MRREEAHLVTLPEPNGQQPELAGKVERLLLQQRRRGLAGLGRGGEWHERCGGRRFSGGKGAALWGELGLTLLDAEECEDCALEEEEDAHH